MGDQKRTLRDRPSRPGMRASLVGGAVLFAVASGVSMERITEATGLRPEDLPDRDGWLPEALTPAIWRLIAEARPGEAVALEGARHAPLDTFGPLTYAVRHAPDLRAGLRAFARYHFTLSDNFRMALIEGEPETRLELYHPMDHEDGGLAAEMGMALGARLGGLFGAGPGPLSRVELAHRPFGPEEAYEEAFGVPVLFGQASNAMIFESERLGLPTKEPDPRLFGYIQAHLDETRRRLTEREEPLELRRIREAIAENAERSEYSAEALASRLGVSLRTLQRRATALRVGVRGLLEEAREANAKELLGDPRLGVEEVAYLLGYSEDRAFRRAFKRWTKETPAQYRRHRRAG